MIPIPSKAGVVVMGAVAGFALTTFALTGLIRSFDQFTTRQFDRGYEAGATATALAQRVEIDRIQAEADAREATRAALEAERLAEIEANAQTDIARIKAALEAEYARDPDVRDCDARAYPRELRIKAGA